MQEAIPASAGASSSSALLGKEREGLTAVQQLPEVTAMPWPAAPGGDSSSQLLPRSRVTLAELESHFGKGRSSSQHQRLQAGIKAAAGLMANPPARRARLTSKVWLQFSKGSCRPNKPKISAAGGAAPRGQRQLEYWGPGESAHFHTGS